MTKIRQSTLIRSLSKVNKLLNSEACKSQDRPECAAIKLFVVGDHDLRKGRITAENHVASFLSFEAESRSL
jgi:hypothetical protein